MSEATRIDKIALGKAIGAALAQCGISVQYAIAGPSELYDVASVLLKSTAMAAHDAEVRVQAGEMLAEAASRYPAVPEEPEVEWEYECRVRSSEPGWDWRPCTDDARFCPEGSERRRRLAAGPWLPVPDRDTPESED